MTKYLTLIVLLFFAITNTTIQTHAQESYKSDSLYQEIKKAKKEKKLELMFALANLRLDSKEMLEIAKEIEQEALLQSNMRYLGGSYALMARHYMHQNNMDSLVYYADLSNDIYSSNNIPNPNETYQYLALSYFNRGYFELAIHNMNIYLATRKYDPEVYNMIGMAYIFSGRSDLARKYYLEAIEMEQSESKVSLMTLYNGLAFSSLYLKDYDAVLKYCAASEEHLSVLKGEMPESRTNIFQLQIDIIYSFTYLSLGDASKGKMYLDKVMENPWGMANDLVQQDVKGILFEYNYLLKNYDKASIYLEEVLDFYRQDSRFGWFLSEYLGRKIKMLKEQGKIKEALQVQESLMVHKDSLYLKDIPLQVSEMSKSYEIAKARIEKENDKVRLQKSQTIIVGFIIVTLLLCLILYSARRNAKKLKKKNKALYKQYAKADKYVLFAKEYLAVQEGREEQSKEGSLFSKIDAYMIETEAYRNCDLSREGVALELGTNRQYLADAVKSETGKTFMDYINDYRLDYARRQLVLDDSLSIENIIHDAGFSSNSTFYRLFKEKFGMTPSELRLAKKELEQELMNDGDNKKKKPI